MRLSTFGWALGGGVVGLLLVSLGWGLTHAAPSPPDRLIGQASPAMTIDPLAGGRIDLASYRGTPLVVNFWASWCVPCRLEAPVLNQAAVQHLGSIQFVGVDMQDSDTAARAFQDEFKSPYPVGPASQGSYLEWGVTAPPETYFISGSGRIVARHVGPQVAAMLEAYLRQLLPSP